MDTPASRLRWSRQRADHETATAAARAFGWPIPTYLGHENGDRNPSRQAAQKYAKAFRVRWEWILTGEGFPTATNTPIAVVGYVAAGGRINFSDPGGRLDEVPRPPESSPATVALRVKGDSMPGVAEDGWVVYYDERREGVTDDFVGALCVCWLENGSAVIKRVYRGRERGRFDLVSTGYEPIRDAVVLFSARVTWIKPR